MNNASLKTGNDVLHAYCELKQRVSRIVEAHNLTEQQAVVMYHLHTNDGLLMSSLAVSMECNPSNITGLIDRLVQQELVERREVPDDRRAKRLHLTKKGRQVVAEILD